MVRDQGTTAWAAVDFKHDGWEAVTPCRRLVRLVAVDRVSRNFSHMGDRRDCVSTRLF